MCIRDSIGIVQQDVFLFAGTIYDNIRYGRPDATEAEVVEAAKRAEIYDDIMQMPDGFQTQVGAVSYTHLDVYKRQEMHSIKGGMANCQMEMKKAVECGYWNLFRYNPALKAEGKNPFTLDSKAPAGGYQEFLMNEARYSSLTRAFPERAKELFARNEEAAKERYEHLTKLVELYK